MRGRARDRLTKPRVAAAYRDLWEGHTAASADPARKSAARHLMQDQHAVRSLGESRVVEETVRCAGPVLRFAVAEGDRDAVGQILRGLSVEHQSALLVEFAGALGVVDMAGTGWQQ
ncbi:hypothetical protein [Nocardiopsis lucentensis]|uniref:hypothetical protein n=1 Tax=Nocardiopsis lucentensis TaxID=53441 RepID=UPI001F4C555E|nr:hypothetical protein [Nocardiopsis lucentensis]